MTIHSIHIEHIDVWTAARLTRLQALRDRGVSFQVACAILGLESKALRLDEIDRKIIALRATGLTFEQIGAKLNMPFSTVHTRARRMRNYRAPDLMPASAPRPENFFPIGNYPYTTKTCRFPLWGDDEKPTHEYCQHPRIIGKPYCEEHARLCFIKPSKVNVPERIAA